MTTTHLDECDGLYDPAARLLSQVFHSPGYHTRIPDQAVVHGTVNSLRYALALLQSGDGDRCQRAAEIIGAVLVMQDTNPVSPTYGIWPWFLEETLATMAPPDWNWADFCGECLAFMLADHAASLPPALVGSMRDALGHAAWSIFRRNMGPAYTNIGLFGGVVAGAAGEILGEARLLDYARLRLDRFNDHTAENGDANEYNSPAYGMLMVRVVESGFHLLRDPQLRNALTVTHRHLWKTISDHYHPATDQWAGPHSRTYQDAFVDGLLTVLGDRLSGSRTVAQDGKDFAPTLPCPEEFRNRFTSLPQPECEVRRQFTAETRRTFLVTGTTWFSETACLGSVNCDSFWTQRRPLIGYWRMPGAAPAVFRCRVLKDGRDFAAIGLKAIQHGPRLLGGLCAFSNLGDYHLHQDHPAEGRYEFESLRLRFQLTGPQAEIRSTGQQSFELIAGEHRVVVHPASTINDGGIVAWESGHSDGFAWMDVTLYQGVRRYFTVAELPLTGIAFGLEMLPSDVAPSAQPPQLEDCQCAIWPGHPGLRLILPAPPQPYPVFIWQPNT